MTIINLTAPDRAVGFRDARSGSGMTKGGRGEGQKEDEGKDEN
jgi:hypothetical protein